MIVCRMCGSGDLEQFLDLGHQPPSNAFLTAAQLLDPETTYPLVVVVCKGCGLVQLGYVVPKEAIFDDTYPYASSTTQMGWNHFFGLAETIVGRFSLGAKDLVIDIGSNVGVLLEGFKEAGTHVLGIEPVRKLAEVARKNGIDTVADFFNVDVGQNILLEYGPAMAITGTNVFAHIDDVRGFAEAVRLLLHPKGVLVIEVPYLVNLLDQLLYDTIYHEHLSYVSMTPVVRFFKAQGLEVFDVELVPFHGGSLRIFIGYPDSRPERLAYAPAKRVGDLLRLEADRQIHHPRTLREFAKCVQENRLEITSLLVDLKRKHKRIVAISAPAKGNTVLNYCRFDTTVLEYATEKAPLKIGLYTPGTHLPVVAESRLFEDKPDFGLLLSWNFATEIKQNLRAFSEQGGKFITALPEPVIS